MPTQRTVGRPAVQTRPRSRRVCRLDLAGGVRL